MMLFRKWLPALVVAAGFSASAAFASTSLLDNRDELDERDFDAIIEYINSKRTIELAEKSCNLALAGDVRFEWHHLTEKANGQKQVGSGSSGVGERRNADNVFDAEFNLYLDYKCDRTWGVAQLEFDNPAGVKETDTHTPDVIGLALGEHNRLYGSGLCDCLCLRKAYFGINICADGCTRWDVEVGRRRLYDVFDSKVQFCSIFDGLLLRYATQVDCLSDAYVNLGAFVIDQRSNHFGWVIEGGVLNICDSGVDLKYSYIDWLKKGENRFGIRKPAGAQFQVSQWTANYHFDEFVCCIPAKAYAALLWNSAAKKIHTSTDNLDKRQNCAWYLGFILGEVCCEGDWSFEANYQYVQAQAVPDRDVCGIGRGNANRTIFAESTGALIDARGNANFQGAHFEALYAVTDNLTLDAMFEFSRATENRLGGSLNYSQWKLGAIYAF